MNKLIIATAFLSFLVMSSCTDDALVKAEKNVVELVTNTEPYVNVHSRTQVGNINEDGSLGMKWSPNDKISIYGGKLNNVVFTNINIAASTSATFTGVFRDIPEYAFYPYNEKATNKLAIPIEIATAQEYINESSVGNYDIKGGNISLTSAGSYSINFSQLASLVRFEVNLKNIENLTLEEGETLESIQLHAKNTLTGDFTVNIIDKSLTEVAASSSLIISFPNQPSLISTEEKIVAYAVVAPGTHLNDEWECDITTSHHWIQFWTTVKADLEQGTFSILPLNATVLKNSYHYDADNQKVEGPHIEKLEDEGENPETPSTELPEPANCYMISAAGTYRFDATIIGNGENGIIANAGFHTTVATIEPKSAELLWQDTQSFITNVTLDETTGVVTYTAGGNVGNAQIAVKDSDGTILWSWHIWGTGDQPVEDDIYTNQAGATFSVMDRNLGQLKTVKSSVFPSDGSMYRASDNTLVSDLAEQLQPTYYSTCYQWGRKDPIPTSPVYYDLNGNKIGDIVDSYPVHVATSEEEASIPYSIKNPDKLIYASTLNSADWLATVNQYLWGDNNPSTLYDWWSDGQLTNEGAGSSWSNQKSIYDPCPAGYRVANKWTFTGFVASSQGSSSFSSSDVSAEALTNNIKCLTTTYLHGTTTRYVPVFCHGYFFLKNESDTDGSYYPMTGYRNGTNGASVGSGTQGYVWSSTRNSNSDSQSTSSALNIGAYNWYFEKITGGHAGPNGNVNVVDFKNRLHALPVRCVRE